MYSNAPTRGFSILLVDDDQDDAELFSEAVSEIDSSIKIQLAKDGQHALDLLGSVAEVPSLIFLDINMPRLNGWQCLIQLKQDLRTRHIPVVMFTTSSQVDDEVMARKLGAAAFIVKPSHFNELSKVLSIALETVR